MVRRNPRGAFASYMKSLELARKNKDWQQYTLTLNRLGFLNSYWAPEETAVIFTNLKEGVTLLKDAKADSSLAVFEYNVADFYDDNTNEIQAPMMHLQRAFALWQSLGVTENRSLADCYHVLGDLYKFKVYDFQAAESNYEKALQIREHIGVTDAKLLMTTYYNLAATNRSQHEYEKALAYGEKALAMTSQIKSREFAELANDMLGNIYRDMNQSAMAKKHYLAAISINKDSGDKGNMAHHYAGLGELAMNDTLYSEALMYLEKAEAIYRRTQADRFMLTYVLQIKCDLLATMNDLTNYRKTFKAMLTELKTLKLMKSRSAAYGYLSIAMFYGKIKRYDSSLYFFQKGLQISAPGFNSLNPADNPSQEMFGVNYADYRLPLEKGIVLKTLFFETRDRKYFDQSLQSLFLAEKLLSLERNTFDMEDSKWKFLESNYGVYEAIISLLYRGAQLYDDPNLVQQAFQYFEQSKVRSLADALTDAELTRHISREDSLLRRHADLKRKLFEAQDNLSQATNQGTAIKSIGELRGEIVKYDREIQNCKDAIEQKYPGYFNVRYGYQTPSLTSVQQFVRDHHRVLLEYFCGSESVYALCILPDKVLFKRLGSADSLRVGASQLLTTFNEHSSLDKASYDRFSQSAHTLYNKLVRPFREQLTNQSTLQIIPDGIISQVPFEVLLTQPATSTRVNYRALSYLIKDFTIGYSYSSSMLGHALIPALRTPSVLAFGFTGGQRWRAPDPQLEEIEGTEMELAVLGNIFKTGKFMEGEDATEVNFKAMAPDFDIIHLAVHGQGDVKKDFAASLYFRKKYDSLEDGVLHAYELYGLKLKARLAVLTSCEAGLGKDFKGEGMLSMASAFTLSGCENILMSLWKVNDQASIGLMDDFYKFLTRGENIDNALRDAKLKYLEAADEITADPIAWAPMVAYGDLEQIFPQKNSRTTWSLVGIAAVLLIALLVFLRRRK
ncbi:Tetratricopeptide repeat-containing protein [Chryseolinea serpens]|uniref:Tetratricopeptide repeat-containing protein n=2 Tax=Chryseolinea serpens TaxID=947013 RepID=A0A1M5P261_9BACT|nr:Tetratricopeptide repeat-containing protein [Chryseolinea serpens]